MTDKVWVVFNRHKVVRVLLSNKFNVSQGEKWAELTINVDDGIFKPLPVLSASLQLSRQTVNEPGQIVLDPAASLAGRSDGQGTLNTLTARLLDKAINSTDPAIKELALSSLAVCRESGIEVRIEIPEQPATEGN